jgi:hypothetical protein
MKNRSVIGLIFIGILSLVLSLSFSTIAFAAISADQQAQNLLTCKQSCCRISGGIWNENTCYQISSDSKELDKYNACSDICTIAVESANEEYPPPQPLTTGGGICCCLPTIGFVLLAALSLKQKPAAKSRP